MCLKVFPFSYWKVETTEVLKFDKPFKLHLTFSMTAFQSDENSFKYYLTTVVPGFRVLGFSALPGFRALKAGDGAWSVHKTLFGFSAPVFQQKIDL